MQLMGTVPAIYGKPIEAIPNQRGVGRDGGVGRCRVHAIACSTRDMRQESHDLSGIIEIPVSPNGSP